MRPVNSESGEATLRLLSNSVKVGLYLSLCLPGLTCSDYISFRQTSTRFISVTYWPSTELSIEKQVHPVEDIWVSPWLVNGLNSVLTGSRWVSNNYITGCHKRFQLVGVSCSSSSSCSSRQWEPAPDRGLAALSDPRLSSPAEWERRAAIVRGTWDQYIAVCSVSNSPITHNPFATLSGIKCERYFFLKKSVRSSFLCWLCFRIYMCIRRVVSYGYTTISRSI